MGDSYRDYLKAKKKEPVAKSSAARSRRSSEAAYQRSQAIKRQQSRVAVHPGAAKQGRFLDGW